jgi:hypothetical protein
MPRPYLFLGLVSLVLSGCAPAWTQKSLIEGPRFSYAVGRGVGVDEESARQAAEITALKGVLKARAQAFVLDEEIKESIQELLDLDNSTSIIAPSIEVITSLRTELEANFPAGWQRYGGKEHIERIDNPGSAADLFVLGDGSVAEVFERNRNLVMVSNVFQFVPEELGDGQWVTNRISPPDRSYSPPGRARFLAENVLLPGLGSILMRRAGGTFNQGYVFMATYLYSWTRWGIANQGRNKEILALNTSMNVNEQAALQRNVDRYQNTKNIYFGVAVGTLLVSLLDVIIGEQDLWQFSPTGDGMFFGLRTR